MCQVKDNRKIVEFLKSFFKYLIANELILIVILTYFHVSLIFHHLFALLLPTNFFIFFIGQMIAH